MKPPAKFDTPAWLQESEDDNSKSNPLVTISFSPPVNNANSQNIKVNNPSTNQAEIDPTIPRLIMLTRITNMILSVLITLIAALSLITTQTLGAAVLACYIITFSCLICCFEAHLNVFSKMIALNFGFMYSSKSRGLFMILVGSILFSISLFGKILGLCMMANAVANIYISFRYPGFDEAHRSNALSDIQEQLAANPAFANAIYTVGAKVATENPELARQGMQTLFTSVVSSASATTSSSGYKPVPNVYSNVEHEEV